MQQIYRGDIQGIELRQAEAQRRRPVGACAPARALQHEAHAMLDGQFQVGPEIILQRLPPSFGAQERDRREEGQIDARSEEHTSELQSLMRISYAVFCLKKKTQDTQTTNQDRQHN